MFNNLIKINVSLILVTFFSTIESFDSGVGVPVLLWTKPEINSLNAKNIEFNRFGSHSSLNRINDNQLKSYYLKSQTIVVFLQKYLSLEQFTTEDERSFNIIKHIINDESSQPLLLTDVLNPSQAINDYKRENINQLNVNNRQKVVINLPKNSLVENDELIGQILEQIGKNLTEETLYVITGQQNTYTNINDNESEETDVKHRFGRHVLSNEVFDRRRLTRKESLDIKRLVNVNDCLYLFTTVVTFNHYNESQSNTSVPFASFDTLNNKPKTVGSKCWITTSNITKHTEALLKLQFRNASKTNGPQINITLTIDSPNLKKDEFWSVKSGSAVVKQSSSADLINYKLITNDITAESQFSYSCSKLTILSDVQNLTSGDLSQISIVFDNFQLQPFKNRINNNINKKSAFVVFADSFDSQTWMTLPLWMGLLSLIMFFTILYFGVYFLSQVNTSDRFENPKAKPLIIANTDE